MFDLTRLARTLGFVLPVYMLLFIPGVLIVDAVQTAFGWPLLSGQQFTWPLPWIFPVLSVVLVGEMLLRLRRGVLTTTQIGGYRMVALLLTFGAAFAMPVTWHPLAVGGALAVYTFLPLKRHAAPSSWVPN